MNFQKYTANKKEEESSGNGYDLKAVVTSVESIESKVPSQLSFTHAAPLTRSLLAETQTHFGEDLVRKMEGEWGMEAPTVFGNKSSSSDDAFGPTMNIAPPKAQGGLTLTSMAYVEQVSSRALEPEPIYYEKYSSFTTPEGDSPISLLTDISKVFSLRSNVDHEPSFDKNKVFFLSSSVFFSSLSLLLYSQK